MSHVEQEQEEDRDRKAHPQRVRAPHMYQLPNLPPCQRGEMLGRPKAHNTPKHAFEAAHSSRSTPTPHIGPSTPTRPLTPFFPAPPRHARVAVSARVAVCGWHRPSEESASPHKRGRRTTVGACPVPPRAPRLQRRARSTSASAPAAAARLGAPACRSGSPRRLSRRPQ